MTVNYYLNILRTKDSLALDEFVQNETEKFGENVLAELENMIDLLEPKCPKCVLELHAKEGGRVNDSKELIVTTEMYTTAACQLDSIYQFVPKILGNEINVPWGESNITLLIQLEKRPVTDMNLSTIYIIRYKLCTPKLLLNKEKICPEIEIDIYVLKSNLGENAPMITNIQHSVDRNTTVTVCWEEYLSAITKVYTVPHSSQSQARIMTIYLLMPVLIIFKATI